MEVRLICWPETQIQHMNLKLKPKRNGGKLIKTSNQKSDLLLLFDPRRGLQSARDAEWLALKDWEETEKTQDLNSTYEYNSSCNLRVLSFRLMFNLHLHFTHLKPHL